MAQFLPKFNVFKSNYFLVIREASCFAASLRIRSGFLRKLGFLWRHLLSKSKVSDQALVVAEDYLASNLLLRRDAVKSAAQFWFDHDLLLQIDVLVVTVRLCSRLLVRVFEYEVVLNCLFALRRTLFHDVVIWRQEMVVLDRRRRLGACITHRREHGLGSSRATGVDRRFDCASALGRVPFLVAILFLNKILACAILLSLVIDYRICERQLSFLDGAQIIGLPLLLGSRANEANLFGGRNPA